MSFVLYFQHEILLQNNIHNTQRNTALKILRLSGNNTKNKYYYTYSTTTLWNKMLFLQLNFTSSFIKQVSTRIS